MNRINIYRFPISLIILFTSSFAFFSIFYPYHLLHKEQMLLFMNADSFIRDYLYETGGLSNLIGDFLTQWFYYKIAGALILSSLLAIWGFLCYRCLAHFFSLKIALFLMILLFVWEGGRSCILNYPLSSTISLIGSVSFFLAWNAIPPKNLRLLLSPFFLGCSIIGFGSASWILLFLMIAIEIKNSHLIIASILLIGAFLIPGKNIDDISWWGKPNFEREYILALDFEFQNGNNQQIEKLLKKDHELNWSSFYYNLYQSSKGQLPEHLLSRYQPATLGLILPIGPSSSYLSMLFSGELWYRLGDMTLAEHCMMLGMIFSPTQKSSRAIKRLAMINMHNQDKAGALKYLRMLNKTTIHKQWAETQIKALDSGIIPDNESYIQSRLHKTDTIRKSEDAITALRQLVLSNPQNGQAYQYLLCYELLAKDLDNFEKDFRPEYLPSALYAEAAMILLARKNKIDHNEIKKYQIPLNIVHKFETYTQMYEQEPQDLQGLKNTFGETYWFYYHFANFER